jgi:hypothetical protein
MKYSTPYLLFEASGCLTLVSVCHHHGLDQKKIHFNLPPLNLCGNISNAMKLITIVAIPEMESYINVIAM